jgi:hypothetical protein
LQSPEYHIYRELQRILIARVRYQRHDMLALPTRAISRPVNSVDRYISSQIFELAITHHQHQNKMTTEPVPTPAALPTSTSEGDWADVSDDENDAPPTITVDSLDLNALSLSNAKPAAQPTPPDTNGAETPAKTKDEDEKGDTNLIQNKYEVAVKLQDLQADPNSPLYSVKSFEELGLYDMCGWS